MGEATGGPGKVIIPPEGGGLNIENELTCDHLTTIIISWVHKDIKKRPIDGL